MSFQELSIISLGTCPGVWPGGAELQSLSLGGTWRFHEILTLGGGPETVLWVSLCVQETRGVLEAKCEALGFIF